MGKVVNIRQPVIDAVAGDLARQLETSAGFVHVDVDDLRGITAEEWRKAARKAGRILGWSVRTLASADGRMLWLIDNRDAAQLTDTERQRRSQLLRAGIDSVTSGSSRHGDDNR